MALGIVISDGADTAVERSAIFFRRYFGACQNANDNSSVERQDTEVVHVIKRSSEHSDSANSKFVQVC